MIYIDRIHSFEDESKVIVGSISLHHLQSLEDFFRLAVAEYPMHQFEDEELHLLREDELRHWLHDAKASPDDLYLFCRQDEKVIALAELHFGKGKSRWHRAECNITILKHPKKHEIRELLMGTLIQSAIARDGVEELFIRIPEDDSRALAWCRRCKFKIQAVIPGAFIREDGTKATEYIMVRTL